MNGEFPINPMPPVLRTEWPGVIGVDEHGRLVYFARECPTCGEGMPKFQLPDDASGFVGERAGCRACRGARTHVECPNCVGLTCAGPELEHPCWTGVYVCMTCNGEGTVVV